MKRGAHTRQSNVIDTQRKLTENSSVGGQRSFYGEKKALSQIATKTHTELRPVRARQKLLA